MHSKDGVHVGCVIRVYGKLRLQLAILETLRYPEVGVGVTGSTMLFSFYDDVIDLTR